MPSGKGEAAQYHLLKATAAAQPEKVETAAKYRELGLGEVVGRLGAPGTYDLPGSMLTGAPSVGTGDEEGASPFVTEKVTSKAATKIDPRYTKKKAISDVTRLDPEAYADKVQESAQFRIMSRLTAEAEQLIAREGPLWDEMLNLRQLPLLEGGAALARENAHQLSRDLKKGGSARRTAMDAVLKQRAQAARNSALMQQVSDSRIALDTWARENAGNVVKAGQDWAENNWGVRDEYQNAVNASAKLMLDSALPLMFEATEKAAQWRYYAHQKNRDKLGRWVQGVTGAIMMIAGTGAGGELLGKAASKVGGIGGLIPGGGGGDSEGGTPSGSLFASGWGQLTSAASATTPSPASPGYGSPR